MGKELIRQVLEPGNGFDNLRLIGGIESPDCPAIGMDMGQLAGFDDIGVVIGAETPLELITKADGLIEFSSPQASVEHAALAAQARIVHVIGTTALSDEQQKRIEAAARHATIVQSSNMSLGVSLLGELTRIAAKHLGDDWDIEILDSHHRHKRDAPSGSALLLAEAVAQARGQKLSEVVEFDRHEQNQPRAKGSIGMTARRGGSIIGEHEVMFAGEGEQIMLTHRAEDRSIYARGALQAFLWAEGRQHGLYDMRDVLGLKG